MSSKSSPAKPKISSPERKESGGAQPEELSSEERAEIALKIAAQGNGDGRRRSEPTLLVI